MKAVGIDVGGTKIEAQVFGADWRVVEKHRIATPRDYNALVAAMAAQIAWADGIAGAALPVGVSAAGLVNPRTGQALTANLCASGQPFPADIAAAARPLTYLNDCRAMALSEAIFGAGRGHGTVMSLILGTGVGGGVARAGRIDQGPTRTGGEFGHMSAPAALVARHGLPVLRCGCGREGCTETLISGPGLARIADAVCQEVAAPPAIAAGRKDRFHDAWQVWLALVADLLRDLTLAIDPDIVVLGGGLSRIDNVAEDIAAALAAAQLEGFDVPPIVAAQGGDASGARGAAYAAWQERADG